MYINLFQKTEISDFNSGNDEPTEIIQPRLKIVDLQGKYTKESNTFKAVKKQPGFLVTNLVHLRPGVEYVVT